jgi:ABC-type multidrug transport system fused ATPase/permease subunit
MRFGTALAQEPTIFLSKKLWAFSEGRRWLIVVYVCMFIISNLILLLPPLIFGSFIREIQASGATSGNLRYLAWLLALLFVTEIGFWSFHGPARIIERTVAFWAEINYRKYLLEGVLALGLTWHGEHDSGDTIDKVNKAGDGLTGFGQHVFEIIQIVVKLLGTSAVLYWFSPIIGISVFFVVLISFVVIFQYDRYLVPQYRKLNEFSNRVMASVFDALSNITSVKILHIEKPILEGVLSRLRAPYTLYQSNSKLTEAKWFTGAIFFQGIAVVPLAFYIYQAVSSGQEVDAGTVSTLYLYLSNLIFIYFGFTGFYQDLTIYKNRVLNAKPIEDAFTAKHVSRREVTKEWNSLDISDLTFAYDNDGGASHLNGIGLHIRKGERVAVIGESGSGKTTFLKVLHGLYPNASGTLGFDEGRPMATSFADLDLKTMLVPQEPEIFSSTIRENITLGVSYPEEDILHAARVANFAKVIDELPRGLDSSINEKGVNLSGGQKQRLALTRALLFAKEKEVILLDESTSSVDSENETEIYTNIWKTFAGKTVIASIHKMNLLKLFDRIYIFEKGKIADTGSFDELLEKNVLFKESWAQFVATHRGD